MYDYISLRVDSTPCNEDITDLIAASLGEIGFESFTPDGTGVTAFIRDEEFDMKRVEDALSNFPIPATFKMREEFIKGEDWNEEWEKNYFQPIVIGDRCVVHSTFHTEVPRAEYEIIVDPKMAFGTGHHSTTSNMMKFILETDLEGKNVIDMGTGTGILAILSCMRGASSVAGIEIDPYAWENAIENVRLNGVEAEMICGDAKKLEGMKPADILLANINRNIIISDIDKYSDALKEGGEMLLSGFYNEDIEIIMKEAEKYNLHLKGIKEDNNWVALRLVKSN
ncbi:MAG: 50S ribosomal protein L11 methyltransferase [Muribaculaceae bacterium]|nr:50S ribosomal protein L11 methyltransferase [Muribaculaceae bacterium]